MASSNCNYSVSHNPKRKQELYVIDCYDSNRDCTKRLLTIIKNVMKVINSRLSWIRLVLFIGLSLQENSRKFKMLSSELKRIWCIGL